MKPERQAGKKVFIGGFWGPGSDKNDIWVVYLSKSDELVFELNGADTDLKSADNTIVTVKADTLYGKWHHIACVYDGAAETAYIYIDGNVIDSARNNAFPLRTMRKTPKNELQMQIGSCNALSDDRNVNRAFLGQLDEIRIWKKVLNPKEIYCWKDVSLNGDEKGLMLYYRCNEFDGVFVMCDATANGNYGLARSGAYCQNSDRIMPPKVVLSPNPGTITDTLKCDTTITWNFSIVDTSICGSSVWMRVIDDEAANYKINPSSTSGAPIVLNPDVSVPFSVTLNTKKVGPIKSRLQILRTNVCGTNFTENINLFRITELGYSKQILDYGLVLASCEGRAPIEITLKICNNTKLLGLPRNVTVSNFLNKLTNVYIVNKPGLPFVLAPDECKDITIRYNPGTMDSTYRDTLYVISDDRCAGSGIIPITSITKNIFKVTTRDGKKLLDSINFGTSCINWPSDPYEYLWSNQVDENIFVDSIIVPKHFLSEPFRFPVTLTPKTGYMPNYFRFLPTAPGYFNDSIIFVVRTASGCTIRKPVYVKGRGFFADVRITTPSLTFGTVIVGRDTTLMATAENFCQDNLSISFYLKDGTAFFLSGGNTFSIAPGQKINIPITFRPINAQKYADELCIFEQRCYNTQCIPISGNGIIEVFKYDPLVMRTENVLGCGSMLDTLGIFNISGVSQTLSNFQLVQNTNKYQLVYPNPLPNSITLANSDSTTFIFRFVPNTVLQDIAERAFLKYKTADGTDWSGKLYGTSNAPKIFITSTTLYDLVEIGDRKRDTLTIENISSIAILIDSLAVTDGFELIYPKPGLLNRTLNSGDTIRAIVDFVPTVEKDYSENIFAYSSKPCVVDESGWLVGSGIMVPLEVPMSVISYGFVRPCDCVTRHINIINPSKAFKRTIDSVWIDSISSDPRFFTWKAFGSPQGKFPWDIPTLSFDTLYVTFCPRTPSEVKYLDHAARINVKASGIGWEGKKFETYLIGKREIMFQAAPTVVSFPPTRVDTFSVPALVKIAVPSLAVNPNRSDMMIDSITFVPNERVFTARDSSGLPFPLKVDSLGYLPLRLDFKPRAVRSYSARMNIHFSQPCKDLDTTVMVYGTGFAPAFGIQMDFARSRSTLDTLKSVYCDTLRASIYTSRDFPADVVDIKLALLYDTTKMKYVGAESPVMARRCEPHTPSITPVFNKYNGTGFMLKNFCRIDSIEPFLIAKFLPVAQSRTSFKIWIDSVAFDTEEVILYKIVPQTDSGIVIIQQPDMKVLNSMDFGIVQVIDCSYDTLRILNTGDVPIMLDIPSNLPKDAKMIGSVPALGDYYKPGDTASIYFEFCPRRKQVFDQTMYGISDKPCALIDSSNIKGEGYVPQQPVSFDITNNFSIPDTVYAAMGDTITIPIMMDNNLSTMIRGTEYWLKDLRFKLGVKYNPSAMKYLSANTQLKGLMNTSDSPGDITLNFKNIDSLMRGKVADLSFLVTVPDSILSSMNLAASEFDTDSLLFIDVVPSPTESKISISGQCNISYIKYSNLQPVLAQNKPNPWNENTKIEFTTQEKAPVTLRIYSMSGALVRELLDGGYLLEPGKYTVEINSDKINSGVYYYVITAGTFSDTKTMTVVK
jgi:hypothetical protein